MLTPVQTSEFSQIRGSNNARYGNGEQLCQHLKIDHRGNDGAEFIHG